MCLSLLGCSVQLENKCELNYWSQIRGKFDRGSNVETTDVGPVTSEKTSQGFDILLSIEGHVGAQKRRNKGHSSRGMIPCRGTKESKMAK